MSDFGTMHDTIRSRFKTQVADIESLLTQYDNDGSFNKPADSPWARFTIRVADSVQSDTGDSMKRYRTTGNAIAQLFVPVQDGDNEILRLADVVDAAFRSVTDTGVVFSKPRAQTIGRDGKWWQVNVTCPFYFDKVA